MKILFLFPGKTRIQRLSNIKKGKAPKDFFYGFFDLVKNGYNVAFADSRKEPLTFFHNLFLYYEKKRNNLLNSGLYKQRIVSLSKELSNSDLAISFTDWFSLSLGLYKKCIKKTPKLVGGFHGLSDLTSRVNHLWKSIIDKKISKALNNLDHVFFFGEADRKKSIELYNIPAEKTSLFLFGIDSDFWCPDNSVNEEDFILSVGTDINRDYELLLKVKVQNKIKIITKRFIKNSKQNNSIEIYNGSLRKSNITDVELRDLYRRSMFVVVPLKDVFQPSGYSVTLQAMACGKPVIISDIKGLWDPELFESTKNCILIKPGDLISLQKAIDKLILNNILRHKIGKAALNTAKKHFNLSRMNKSIADLIKNNSK